MDLATLIIGLVATGLLASPFLVSIAGKNKREKDLKNTLSDLAAKHQGKLTLVDCAAEHAIGLDDNLGYLFFIRKNREGLTEVAMDLSKMTEVKGVVSYRPATHHGKTDKIIERISLLFSEHGGSSGQQRIVLYDYLKNTAMYSELEQMKNWERTLGSIVKKQSHHPAQKALTNL